MSGTDEARDHVKKAADDARSSASRVAEHLREAGADVKQAATEQVGHMAEQAGQYYRKGKQRAMEWEGSLEDCVREKPLKSLLIAAGIGVLLGAFWRRR